MAIARDLAGDAHHVVAVIGDGAITGGMALEALNQTGHLGSKLIVILNDNGMSISPTVGALARLLSKVRFDPRYHRAKEESRRVLHRLPLGKRLWDLGERVESGIKGFVMPSTIWEELGFSYVGPIDGHDIAELKKIFTRVRDYQIKPALIHVSTTKGKGYLPAESNAVYFHGVSAKSGKSAPKIPTYSEVFAQTVLSLARQNPKLVTITPAMPEGNCLSIVKDEFPDRVFDVGICEQHAVTFAAGLATQGFTPIVAIYSTFLQRAFDQLIHDVCLQELPVVFAIDRGGIVGDDGKTHQGAFDLSYLTLIPNLIVAAPKDENELRHLLYTATKALQPMAVRYPRATGQGVKLDAELHQIPIGQWEILRGGEDIAILAVGAMVTPALEAARELASHGIEATIVNARFVKPLDTKLITELTSRIKRVVTVEENALSGGFGSSLAGLLQKAGKCHIQIKSLGIPDEFVEHGSQTTLRAKYNLNAEGIVQQVLTSFPDLNSDSRLAARSEARTTSLREG
jgi:1-deoxy-D-xylulose-5-phosphate synthase